MTAKVKIKSYNQEELLIIAFKTKMTTFNEKQDDHPSYSFTQLFRGTLRGLRTEEEYEALAKSSVGTWFASKFGDGDVKKIDGSEVCRMLLESKDMVKKRNMLNITFPYTYVANPEEPQMIKIYDPLQCGSGCSTSSPDPWWVFSRVEPAEEELRDLMTPKEEKSGIVSRLFGR